MTTKEFIDSMTYQEKEDFAAQMSNWLRQYTQEVYVRVMKQFEEIINNPFALELIKELFERENKEVLEDTRFMCVWMGEAEKFEQFNPHNHCLTHSGSYRNILYDMFIGGK